MSQWLCPISKIVNISYSKFSNQYELDDYIRKLRNMVIKLKLQNDFLLKEESYLPLKVENMVSFNTDKKYHTDLAEVNIQYKAITITFDHKKFPQLIITPKNHQQNYIEKVISICIREELFTGVYGCFELQGNGTIHGHFIIPYYGDEKLLYEKLIPYFTDRKQKQYAIVIKTVDDIVGWFTYMHKESKDFIEYNLMKKNSLDLF